MMMMMVMMVALVMMILNNDDVKRNARKLPTTCHGSPMYADDDLGSDDHGGDDEMKSVHMMLINTILGLIKVMRMMMHDMVCR